MIIHTSDSTNIWEVCFSHNPLWYANLSLMTSNWVLLTASMIGTNFCNTKSHVLFIAHGFIGGVSVVCLTILQMSGYSPILVEARLITPSASSLLSNDGLFISKTMCGLLSVFSDFSGY